MKQLTILGSTGSIGKQTLEIVKSHPDQFQVKYLTANQNIQLLAEQATLFNIQGVCVSDRNLHSDLENLLRKRNIEILSGRDGLIELSGRNDIDLLVNSLVGASGMAPTIAAIKAGVDVALSNKESLVMAGDHIVSIMQKTGANLYPIDSEHSAIWQCLRGEIMDQVKKIILTGSGGPFRSRSIDTFSSIKKEDALNHPNWEMGNKITIDSATMMNKGLEVIEAHWLFGMSDDKIEIVIHPQSIIHSMVEFKDGSIKAQLGLPNMKIPIQYAMTYPNHMEGSLPTLDLNTIGTLTFEPPDLEKFRCIQLAFDVLQCGGSAPAVLNVANDEAVFAFLDDQIQFTDIPIIIEMALNTHKNILNPNLDEINEIINWTKKYVREVIKKRDKS